MGMGHVEKLRGCDAYGEQLGKRTGVSRDGTMWWDTWVDMWWDIGKHIYGDYGSYDRCGQI